MIRNWTPLLAPDLLPILPLSGLQPCIPQHAASRCLSTAENTRKHEVFEGFEDFDAANEPMQKSGLEPGQYRGLKHRKTRGF